MKCNAFVGMGKDPKNSRLIKAVACFGCNTLGKNMLGMLYVYQGIKVLRLF